MKKVKNPKKKRVLLVISIVLLVVIASGAGYFVYTASYASRLRRAEEKLKYYQDKGFSEGEVLLCGSSSIEYWESFEEDLAPLTTYNVGVGGTIVSEWTGWVDKMIVPFKPRAVVIYVGANDITGLPNSKAGEVVAEELKELFTKINTALPETKIYYISISPSVSKAKVWGEVDKCNKLVEAYCGENDYLNFIDCTPALLNADGSYRTELFRIDTLHFNEKGYEVWTSVIAPILINDLGDKK